MQRLVIIVLSLDDVILYGCMVEQLNGIFKVRIRYFVNILFIKRRNIIFKGNLYDIFFMG